MHQNIPSDPEMLSQHIADIVQEIMTHGFMTTVVDLEGREMTVIASKGDGTDENPIVPMFLLPSPEIMLSLTDPKTGNHLFKMANMN